MSRMVCAFTQRMHAQSEQYLSYLELVLATCRVPSGFLVVFEKPSRTSFTYEHLLMGLCQLPSLVPLPLSFLGEQRSPLVQGAQALLRVPAAAKWAR
jgi:hypothetical protein